MRAEFAAGYRAGLLFAIDQALRVADGVEARTTTKRADGAAHALRVLAEELLREIGGEADARSGPAGERIGAHG
ncbi:hypothetical protein EDE12_11271 [Methylosinus sp. sav-2]|uniref:hypothetical protein n=1 Tax=Methylosinus sp. sav-2 TaxID=2485168 RepID=UPI00047DE546|nr:hypothetical protein [Methylosinus sp. sav-2]TDX61969.1 hypothetical protein EDE12_11271 [Methylosinus sp. sav-2]